MNCAADKNSNLSGSIELGSYRKLPESLHAPTRFAPLNTLGKTYWNTPSKTLRNQSRRPKRNQNRKKKNQAEKTNIQQTTQEGLIPSVLTVAGALRH